VLSISLIMKWHAQQRLWGSCKARGFADFPPVACSFTSARRAFRPIPKTSKGLGTLRWLAYSNQVEVPFSPKGLLEDSIVKVSCTNLNLTSVSAESLKCSNQFCGVGGVWMSFSASEEVIVSFNKNQASGSCPGVVINTDEDRMQIALKGLGLVLRHGDLLYVKSTADDASTAWSSVQQVTLAGDVKIVHLSSTRDENSCKPRSTRLPIEIGISANYSDRDKNTKRTMGQTIDLSISGIRARFRTAVPEGGAVLVVLHLNDDKTVEAIAKVVRIVENSRSASGGYEVGLEFQRFIRGYDYFIEMATPDQAA